MAKGVLFLAALGAQQMGETVEMWGWGMSGVFCPLDILFLLFAVATAYKVASGGGSDD
jgi:hypothetical protein